jgi:hypothetical protein
LGAKDFVVDPFLQNLTLRNKMGILGNIVGLVTDRGMGASTKAMALTGDLMKFLNPAARTQP